jgi:23S rRNA (adenine2503-C2)-methyltransferase
MKIIQSKQAPLKKITFPTPDHHSYHTISICSFEDKALIICVSTQVGCKEDCSFCATGSSPFIRNLTIEEMEQQYLLGFTNMTDYEEITKYDLLCIILEGMGEASHNINNTLNAFKNVYAGFSNLFGRIAFRISSAGNIDFVMQYKSFIKKYQNILNRVTFQAQLSLHSPFEHERRWLMPSVSKRNRLIDTIREFHQLSDFLDSTLVCNYMLLDFPQGGCNYTDRHLHEIMSLLNHKRVEIKLTTYSETDRGFSSPDEAKFEEVKAFFLKSGFKTKVKKLLGNDICGACGMLHH